MAEPSDDRSRTRGAAVEQRLRRLGDLVLVPAHPDYTESVRRRLEAHAASGQPLRSAARRPRQRLRPLLAVSVALSVVVAVVVSVPDARRAVADLFGLNGVRVLPLPPSGAPRTTIDTADDFGEPVTLSQAAALVSFEVAVPRSPGLARPDSVFVQTGSGLESVTLVYRPGPGLPEVPASDVGLILSEYAGEAAPYFDKYVDQRRPPTPVTVGGAWPGLRFAGRQLVLIHGSGGVVYSEHARISAPALVWQKGDVTYRLEADIGKQRALEIAGTVR